MTGAIKDQLINQDDIALATLKFMREYNPAAIIARYHLPEDAWENNTDVELLLLITQKLGFKDDYDRASERLLIDLRRGKLGEYTVEMPEDNIGVVQDDQA